MNTGQWRIYIIEQNGRLRFTVLAQTLRAARAIGAQLCGTVVFDAYCINSL